MQGIYLNNNVSVVDSTSKTNATPSNDSVIQHYLDAYLSAIQFGQTQQLDLALEQVDLLRSQGLFCIEGIQLASHNQLAAAIYLEAGKTDEAIQILSESRGLHFSDHLLFHFYAEDLIGNAIPFETGLKGWPLDEKISQAASRMEERDWNGAIEVLEEGLNTADFCATEIYQHLLVACYARSGSFDKASEMMERMSIADHQKMIGQDLMSAMANQSTTLSLLSLINNWARAQLN